METKAFYIENKIETIVYPLLFKIGFKKNNSEYTNFVYQNNIRYVYRHFCHENNYHELIIETEVLNCKDKYEPHKTLIYSIIPTTVGKLSDVDIILQEFNIKLKILFPYEMRKIKIKSIINGNI